MADLAPPTRTFLPARGLLTALAVAALATLTWAVFDLRQQVVQLTTQARSADQHLESVVAEVTRTRIEQRAEGQGPRALLEKLHVYAPMLSSSSVAKPEYESLRKEMQAILLAFKSIGPDGHGLVLERFRELKPDVAYDEMKWLLKAAIATDPERGKELTKHVLLGQEKPNPRLRWWAADVMMETDRQLAQQLLRTIVTTESCRGLDPNRAVANNLSALDPAAVATTGFSNFLSRYLQSGDADVEATLLMVLGRTEHDTVTLQECIRALGERKSQPAAGRIEELYQHPPGAQENPIFLGYCLDALKEIRGKDARSFLETELKKTRNDLVANRIKALLQDLDGSSPLPRLPAGQNR